MSKTEDVVLLKKIKYLTDLINGAATNQNNQSIRHGVQRSHQNSVQGHVGSQGQGYYAKKQTTSSSEGKSYTNSWKNSKQKSADLRKFVWKKSNKNYSGSSSSMTSNSSVDSSTHSNQHSITAQQGVPKAQSKCNETSDKFLSDVSGRLSKSNLPCDKIPQGHDPQNTSKNSSSDKKNLRNSNPKPSFKKSHIPNLDSSPFVYDSCQKASNDNVQTDLKRKKTLLQVKAIGDKRINDKAVDNKRIDDKAIDNKGIDDKAVDDKAIDVDSSDLSNRKDNEVLASKKLSVVPNFVRKKILLVDSSVSSESSNFSSKSSPLPNQSSKYEKMQRKTSVLPSDVKCRQLSAKTLKQINSNYAGPLDYHDQQSLTETESSAITSHSSSLKSDSCKLDEIREKACSKSAKPFTDELRVSEHLIGESSVVRSKSCGNQNTNTEKTLITKTADTAQHSHSKVFVKPSFLQNYLSQKTTASSLNCPSASQAKTFHSCENEKQITSSQQLSSKDRAQDIEQSVSESYCDVGFDAARKKSHEISSTSSQEREAVKSQLSLQLAQTEAKIQQLKRNIVNTKVTLGSAESIDLRKHKTSPVKSTIHQNQNSFPGVQRSRSMPILKTTASVKDQVRLHEKVEQGNLIFHPQYSQNKTTTYTSNSLQHRNAGLGHGIKFKKFAKLRNVSHCVSQHPSKDKKVVFDPKYKLTKSTSGSKTPQSLKNGEAGFTPAKINVMANIIKSKYKFRRNNTSAPPRSIIAHHTEMSNKKPASSASTTIVRPQAKVIKSKYKLKKISSDVQTLPLSVSQSKYKLRKFISSDTSPSASPSKYKLTNLKKVISSIGNDHSNTSMQGPLPPPDVPSLQRQSFKFTQQGQLIYTPYGIQKYHTFSSNSTSRSNHRKRNSKRVGHRTASQQHYRTRFNSQHPVNKKFVTKRRQRHKKQKPFRTRSKFIVLNGMLYKSSSTSLVRTSPVKSSSTTSTKTSLSAAELQIAKPSVVNSGANNKSEGANNRVDIGGVMYVRTGQGTLERFYPSNTRTVASRVVSRSKAMVAAKHRKDNTKQKKLQYCLFYNRFGKCQRGEQCPYIHDPDKIAVCTRFLRGTCQVKGCLFSHKVDKDKMPVCSYFLRGVCIRDNCPYLHVNVGKKASVCPDFLRGFCPLGVKCKKKHTLECPAFSKTGRCPDGEKCRLSHKKVKRKKKLSKNSESTSAPQKRSADVTEDSDDSNIPFKIRKLPTFISIAASQTEPVTDQTEREMSTSVRIKPKF